MNSHKLSDIIIIDLDVGNLFSIERACEVVGLHSAVSADASRIASADALILPGVGAYARAMTTLHRSGLIPVLADFRESNRPILGICLGMQLLMDYSEEHGRHEGLGFLRGSVRSLEHQVSGDLPHIGWSPIYNDSPGNLWNGTLLNNFSNYDYQYFVHSYYVSAEDGDNILAWTRYSEFSFCAVVQKDNVTGCQFHPERSGCTGLEIFKQWSLHNGLSSRNTLNSGVPAMDDNSLALANG